MPDLLQKTTPIDFTAKYMAISDDLIQALVYNFKAPNTIDRLLACEELIGWDRHRLNTEVTRAQQNGVVNISEDGVITLTPAALERATSWS